MEFASAGGHVIENTTNIQIFTEDLYLFFLSFPGVQFLVQWLQCSTLYTLIYDYDYDYDYRSRMEGAAVHDCLFVLPKYAYFAAGLYILKVVSLSTTWDEDGSRQLCSDNLQPVPPYTVVSCLHAASEPQADSVGTAAVISAGANELNVNWI